MVQASNPKEQQIPARIGKYRVTKLLGRGSMGIVYQARDPEIDRLVAIKTIDTKNLQGAKNVKFQDRLQSEAKSLGKLRHSNIVSIFEANFSAETPYLVMDYVTGEGLDQLIKRSGPVAPQYALYYLKQIASAIDYAHSQGVIHRDLKPANCMLELNEQVFVLDFGIAKIHSHFADQTVTEDFILGSPAYMSPEQIKNEPVGPASDIFSFAVLAFELLTAARPFDGASFTETMTSILTGEPKSLTAISDLPFALESVFAQALSKLPEQRFLTAEQFVQACAKACGVSEISHPRNSTGFEKNERIHVWDKRTTLSDGLSNSNIMRPKPISTLGKLDAGMLSELNTEIKVKLPIKKTLNLQKFATMALASLCFFSGLYLFLILTEPKQEQHNFKLLSAQRKDLAVKVGKSNSVMIAGKSPASLSDRELISALRSEALSDSQLVIALDEIAQRKLPELVEILPSYSGNMSYLVRKKVLKLIADIKLVKLSGLVVQLLEDQDASIRKEAARTLGLLSSPRTLNLLKARIKIEKDASVRAELKSAYLKISGTSID